MNASCFRRSSVCYLENIGECLQKNYLWNNSRFFMTFDFLLIFCWLFINFSELNIDFLLTFYTCIHYEHTLFLDFLERFDEQEVKKKSTKSEPNVNHVYVWTPCSMLIGSVRCIPPSLGTDLISSVRLALHAHIEHKAFFSSTQ